MCWHVDGLPKWVLCRECAGCGPVQVVRDCWSLCSVCRSLFSVVCVQACRHQATARASVQGPDVATLCFWRVMTSLLTVQSFSQSAAIIGILETLGYLAAFTHSFDSLMPHEAAPHTQAHSRLQLYQAILSTRPTVQHARLSKWRLCGRIRHADAPHPLCKTTQVTCHWLQPACRDPALQTARRSHYCSTRNPWGLSAAPCKAAHPAICPAALPHRLLCWTHPGDAASRPRWAALLHGPLADPLQLC